MLFTPAQIKLKSFKLRRNSLFFFFFLPGVDASHVYVRAWALGCFHSLISTHTPSTAFQHIPPRRTDVVNQCLEFDQYLSEGADRIGGQLRGDKKCPFSGVTKSGRVWRKVPESDARSVGLSLVQSLCSSGPRVRIAEEAACWGYVHKAVVDVVEHPQAGQSVVFVAQDLSTQVQIAKHVCTSA